MSRGKQDRKKRVPLGTPRMKLSVEVPQGKVGRWVNDSAGRIDAATDGGYELVRTGVHVGEDAESGNSSLDSCVSRRVGVQDDGEPLTAYLMVIDKDLYDEDQDVKQAELDKVAEAIKTGKLENNLGKHGYTPEGGISVK